MNRKGIETLVILTGVIALALAAVILIYLGATYTGDEGFINKFNISIPGFGSSSIETQEGTAKIALDLRTRELKYFTGSKWAAVPKDKETLKLGEISIDTRQTSDIIHDFYTKTSRKKEHTFYAKDLSRKLSIASSDAVFHFDKKSYRPDNSGANRQTKYYIDSGYYVQVFDAVPEGYISLEERDRRIGVLLSSDNKWYVQSRNVYKGASIKQRKIYADFFESIKKWRDQILKDGDCEKFIELRIKEGDVEKEQKYEVEGDYPYLIIDLNEQVEGQEKYGLCADENEKISVNNAEIRITFKPRDGLNGLYWGNESYTSEIISGERVKRWHVYDFRNYLYRADSNSAGEFRMSDAESANFLLGLRKIVSVFDQPDDFLIFAGNDYSNVGIYIMRDDEWRQIYYFDGKVSSKKAERLIEGEIKKAYNAGIMLVELDEGTR